MIKWYFWQYCHYGIIFFIVISASSGMIEIVFVFNSIRAVIIIIAAIIVTITIIVITILIIIVIVILTAMIEIGGWAGFLLRLIGTNF